MYTPKPKSQPVNHKSLIHKKIGSLTTNTLKLDTFTTVGRSNRKPQNPKNTRKSTDSYFKLQLNYCAVESSTTVTDHKIKATEKSKKNRKGRHVEKRKAR